MRVGILGGTFDPIHMGHLLMVEVVREALGLNRVMFVPAGDPPHKQDVEKTGAHHRRKMIELAIKGNSSFELCPVDLDRPGPHYSVDTVSLIRAQYGLSVEDCFFIIGSDSLVELPTWHKPGELIKLCRLAVVHRPGYQSDMTVLEKQIPGLSSRLDWVEIVPALELASSAIRARVKTGQSIRYQVMDKVREYIEQQGLYRRPECGE